MTKIKCEVNFKSNVDTDLFIFITMQNPSLAILFHEKVWYTWYTKPYDTTNICQNEWMEMICTVSQSPAWNQYFLYSWFPSKDCSFPVMGSKKQNAYKVGVNFIVKDIIMQNCILSECKLQDCITK